MVTLLALVALSLPAVAAASSPQLAYVTGTTFGTPMVWIVNADGSAAHLLGAGTDALIAPGGGLVAASLFGTSAGAPHGPALAVYSTSGAPRSFFDLAAATIQTLAWSADSRYLAVALSSTSVNHPERGSGLAIIDLQTGGTRVIAHGAIFGASFAPGAGDRIAYARASSEALSAPVDVYTAAADGSHTRRITHDGRSLYPVWGPHWIALDRERLRRNDAPVYQVWLVHPNGRRRVQLTHVHVPALVSGLVPLAWSADGHRLLGEFGGQDTSEAWTISVVTHRAHRLLVGGRAVVGDGLSRDGKTVLVTEGALGDPPSQDRIATLPFAGGHATTVVVHGALASWNA